MERIVTLIGVLVAVLALIFQLVAQVSPYDFVLLAASVILVGIGVLTGR